MQSSGSTIKYQHNTIQYSTMQYNTIQYSTIQHNTIQYNIASQPSKYNTDNTKQYNTDLYYTLPGRFFFAFPLKVYLLHGSFFLKSSMQKHQTACACCGHRPHIQKKLTVRSRPILSQFETRHKLKQRCDRAWDVLKSGVATEWSTPRQAENVHHS